MVFVEDIFGDLHIPKKGTVLGKGDGPRVERRDALRATGVLPNFATNILNRAQKPAVQAARQVADQRDKVWKFAAANPDRFTPRTERDYHIVKPDDFDTHPYRWKVSRVDSTDDDSFVTTRYNKITGYSKNESKFRQFTGGIKDIATADFSPITDYLSNVKSRANEMGRDGRINLKDPTMLLRMGEISAYAYTGRDMNHGNFYVGAALDAAFDPITYSPIVLAGRIAKLSVYGAKLGPKLGLLPKIAARLLEPIEGSRKMQYAFELGAGFGANVSGSKTDEMMDKYFPNAPGYVRAPTILAGSLPGALLGGSLATGGVSAAFREAFISASTGDIRIGGGERMVDAITGRKPRLPEIRRNRAIEAIEEFSWELHGDQMVYVAGRPGRLGMHLTAETVVHQNIQEAARRANSGEVIYAVVVSGKHTPGPIISSMERAIDPMIGGIEAGYMKIKVPEDTVIVGQRGGGRGRIDAFDAWAGEINGRAHRIQEQVAEGNEAAYSKLDPEGVRLAQGEIIPGRPYIGQADDIKPDWARPTDDIIKTRALMDAPNPRDLDSGKLTDGADALGADLARQEARLEWMNAQAIGLPGGMRTAEKAMDTDVASLRDILTDMVWNRSDNEALERFYLATDNAANAKGVLSDPAFSERNIEPRAEGDNVGAEGLEGVREAVLRENQEALSARTFTEPFSEMAARVPMGDYKIRAAELLDELDDDMLNAEIPLTQALHLVTKLVNKRDINNHIAAYGSTWDDVYAQEAFDAARQNTPPSAESKKILDSDADKHQPAIGAEGPAHNLLSIEGKRVPRSKADPYDSPIEEANKHYNEPDNTPGPPMEPVIPKGVAESLYRTPVFFKPFRDLMEWTETVDPSTHWIVRILAKRLGINPSKAAESDIAQIGIGQIRTQMNGVKNVELALTSALDSLEPLFGVGRSVGPGGKIFDLDENQNIRGLGAHWNDVMTDPEKYLDKMNPAQRKYTENMLILRDDVQILRDYYGLPKFDFTMPDGKLYLPRIVKSIDGIDVSGRGTNNTLDRMYELASDGVANGIKYATPRETMRLYMLTTADQIVSKMLKEEVLKYSVSTNQLVNAVLRESYVKSIADFQEARKLRNTLRAEAKKELPSGDITAMLKKAEAELIKASTVHVQQRRLFKNEVKRLETGGVTVKSLDQISGNNRVFGAHEGSIPLKLWRGRWVARADWEQLKSALDINTGGDSNFLALGAEWIAKNTRLLQTGFDFAAPFMQGAPHIFLNPQAWSLATLNHYKNWALPGAYSRYVRDNLDSLTEAARYGVTVGEAEAFEALVAEPGSLKPLGGLFSKFSDKLDGKLTGGADAGVVRRTAAGAVRSTVDFPAKQLLARFQASYNSFLVTLRNETWKARRGSFNNLHELGRLINNETGGLNSKALGVTNNQRRLEAFWMALSPRYLRSTVAMFAMAAQPNTEGGRAALKDLAKFAGGMTFAYVGTSLLLQELGVPITDEDIITGLNPLSGKKFLSIKIGDHYIGLGGQVRSIIQLVTALGANAIVEPEKNFSMSYYENPALAFIAGRGAPGAAVVATVAEGVLSGTLDGKVDVLPYENINSPIDIAKQLGSSMLPFTIQAVLLEDQPWSMAAIGAQGLRVSPLNRSELTNKDVKDMATREGWKEEPVERTGIAGLAQDFLNKIQEETGIGDDINPNVDRLPIDDYDKLNNEQKREFKEEYPFDRTTANDNITSYFDQVKTINIEWNKSIMLMSQLVLNDDKFTREDFKAWYKGTQQAHYARLAQVREDFDKIPAERIGFEGSVTEYLNSSSAQPEDKAVNDYYNLFDKAKMAPADGSPIDWEALDESRGKFLNSLPKEVADYVKRQTQGGDKEFATAMEADMYFAREVTQPYWVAPEEVFQMMKGSTDVLNDFESIEDFEHQIGLMGEQYGITQQSALEFMVESVPEFKLMYDIIGRYQANMVLADQQLDKALADWYGFEPADRIGYALWQFGESDPATPILASMLSGREERLLAMQAGMSLRNRGLTPSRRRTFNRAFTTNEIAQEITRESSLFSIT